MPLRRLRTTSPSTGISSSCPSCMAQVYRPGEAAKRQKPPEGGCRAAPVGGLVAGLVDQLVLLDPGHHGAQLLAHDLDRALRVEAATRLQGRRARAVLDDEALGVLARLDVLEHLLHHLLR